MADYSYQKSDPDLSAQSILDGTGITTQSILTTPGTVTVVTTETVLSPADEASLDEYMLDLGFEKVFPA